MQAAVSIGEYLTGDYEPDCDYVDGVLEERNLGESNHAGFQRSGSSIPNRCAPKFVTPVDSMRYENACS
jgi:hypothetical protein